MTGRPAHDEASSPRPAGPGISGGQALQQLLDGNKRYLAGTPAHPHQTAARRAEVAGGQHPFAVVLGCADSRVPPEIIFDQGLGDLFTIRVAGNVANDYAVIGSLEYVVATFGIPLIMVLGHKNCGALQATLDAVLHGAALPGHVDQLVEMLRPAVTSVQGHLGDPLDNAVRANVALVVAQLEGAEPILAPAVRDGRLKIVGARYDLDTGVVDIIG